MKHFQRVYGVLITAILFLLAVGPVWAEQESTGEGVSSPAVEEVAEVAEVAEAGASQTEDATEATGLDIVLDGSSLASFEKGLEEVKETSASIEYLSLEKSIDFLLFYDLAAKKDKEKLAQRLDGMTGRQIIEKVNQRRR